MKKRSYAIAAVVLLIAIVAPFVLGACSVLSLTLKRPTLSYADGVVEWGAVGYANSYSVSLYADDDGAVGDKISGPETVTNTNYVIRDYGIVWIGVKAVSSRQFFEDSAEAFLRVEKKDTSSDVTVPDDPVKPDDPTEPDDPSVPDKPTDPSEGSDALPSSAPDLGLPAGAVRKFNYVVYGGDGISVAMTDNTDKVTRLFVNGGELVGGWRYDSANNAVELEKDLFSDISAGIDTEFTAMTESGEIFDFYVTVTNKSKMPAGIDLPSYGAYLFCKNASDASEGVKVAFDSSASVQAVSMDGTKVQYTTANYSLTSTSVTFKEKYLASLGYGLHEAELFTTNGIIDFYLFVYSTSIMCYDLYYEFDDCYPSLVLGWSVDYPIDKFEVVVNGTVYSDENYPERFDGNTFDLTGLCVGSISASVRSYVDGVATPAVSASLAYADNTSKIAAYLDKEQGFEYLGEKHNRYIDSDEEMDLLAYYMILYNDDLPTRVFNTVSGEKEMTYVEVFVDPSLGVSDASDVMRIFAESCAKYKESIKYSYAALGMADGAYCLGMLMVSQNDALYDSTTQYSEAEENEFHLTRSTRASDFDDFAINDRKEVSVESSDQLFFAAEAGYQPVPVAGSVAENLYKLAKDVCRAWIDDSMTDYEKVHAIYDWLGKNVIYDHNIVKEMGNIQPSSSLYNKFYSYDSFYLEGVFENGVAVCNGIAKSFVLLCSIEGISAVKVNGTVSSGAHAWNKVYINGKWYLIDSTWSNQNDEKTRTEGFTHDYLFMMSAEAASRNEQTADTLGYYCGDVLIGDNFR